MYIDKLNGIVKKHENTYHRTIKMKPVDVKPSTFTDFNKENNQEIFRFQIGDNVRISKYNNILAKKMRFKLVWKSVCH